MTYYCINTMYCFLYWRFGVDIHGNTTPSANLPTAATYQSFNHVVPTFTVTFVNQSGDMYVIHSDVKYETVNQVRIYFSQLNTITLPWVTNFCYCYEILRNVFFVIWNKKNMTCLIIAPLTRPRREACM